MLHDVLVLKGLSKTTMRRIAEQIHDENASHGMFRINDKTRWKTFQADVRIKGANRSSFSSSSFSLPLSLSGKEYKSYA